VEREPTAIEQVADVLWRVPLKTLTLPPATRINVYVWRSAAGIVVVDPGATRRAELAKLEAFVFGELRVDALAAYLVTHHHRDHWAGLPALLERRPAPVVAVAPEHYGRLDAAFRPPAWLSAKLGEAALLETPGHASDHLVARTEAGDVLAGDLVAGLGTVVINPPDGDMRAYLASLERLLSVGVRRLLPAHGPTIDDGPAKLREYLEHRALRERQVLDALAALQPTSPMGLVPRVYPELGLVLRPVAARSVLAHLLKLESEGRAEQVGRKWRLR
jgi:glyoxylase-like metal-dependent hydrolase (beta-lactamase superfamily II)